MRVLFSLILYGIIWLIAIREKIAYSDWLRFFFCGLFGVALNQNLFFEGISRTSSIHGALIMILTPLITFVASSIVARKQLKGIQFIGIILGIVGTSVLILWQPTHGTPSALGDFLVILNALSYAIYLIIVKPLMSRYNPLTVIMMCFGMGSLLTTPWSFLDIGLTNWTMILGDYFWYLFFVLFFATFLVYLLNVVALKSVSSTAVSSFIYTQPLFAILIATTWKKEPLEPYVVLGGGLIGLGLWLTNSQKRE
ncbi:MAG: DMT family transporter [Chitinophagales bacterium]|nr:DMT family transporter [Chitinophagales bacterium]